MRTSRTTPSAWGATPSATMERLPVSRMVGPSDVGVRYSAAKTG